MENTLLLVRNQIFAISKPSMDKHQKTKKALCEDREGLFHLRIVYLLMIDTAFDQNDVLGAKGAVEILHRKDLGDADKIADHVANYEEKFLSPFRAAELGYIDEVIKPQSTRRRVCRAFALLEDKQLANPWKKHDNLPL